VFASATVGPEKLSWDAQRDTSSISCGVSVVVRKIIAVFSLLCAATTLSRSPVEIRLVHQAKIPFASSKGWNVDFYALYFRSKVFTFFNISHPISIDQMELF
jgi:hypothetical protein